MTIQVTEKCMPDSIVIGLKDPKEKLVDLNPLSVPSPCPTLLVLEGQDGRINHSVRNLFNQSPTVI